MFPTFVEAKKLIEQGVIGQLKSIEYIEGAAFGWQSLTGFYVNPAITSKGIMMDLGPHVIDTICWLAGGKPDVVEFLDDSFGGPESVARVKAEYGGCQISIFLNRLVDMDSKFVIKGDLGSIQGKPMKWQELSIFLNDGIKETKRLPCEYKNYPEFVAPIVENFFNVLDGTEVPLVSGADVQDSIEFIDECYKKRKRFLMPWYRRICQLRIRTIKKV